MGAAYLFAINVLVFSKTEGYRHEAIPDGVRALEAIADERGWRMDATEDSAVFRADNLASYDVIVFLMTTGDVLNGDQQAALEKFVGSSKGFVGIHSASDTEHDWPWYRELVGAYFKSHPGIQPASYVVERRDHPATRMLPETWVRTDEHYTFDGNPRGRVEVLVSLDETSYGVEEHAMGDHPVVWHHRNLGGRAFYTALGHTSESYQDPLFRAHIAGAIAWAASSQED
ncbi:MAG TPA: ThuA domain-containing protein [Vicinamibacteria bacterium]|nr:ThuA domain-containing protein [Vicinamibacteria bacterium]